MVAILLSVSVAVSLKINKRHDFWSFLHDYEVIYIKRQLGFWFDPLGCVGFIWQVFSKATAALKHDMFDPFCSMQNLKSNSSYGLFYKYIIYVLTLSTPAQSAGAIEYTDCISAEE